MEEYLYVIEKFIIPFSGVIIGSLVTVLIFKRQETKSKDMHRLESIHKLMKMINEFLLEIHDIEWNFNIMNKDSLDKSKKVYNETRYLFVIDTLSYALHIDEETFSKTLEALEFFQKEHANLGKPMENIEEYRIRILKSLENMSIKYYELVNFCDTKRHFYYNIFVKKHLK